MGVGGYINIGIVFNKDNDLVETMETIRDFITKNGSEFISVKYSKDIDGEVWLEHEIQNNKVEKSFLNGFYTTFELSGSFLGLSLGELNLTIQKESNYFGFLFGIGWEYMFPKDSDDANIPVIREHIVNTLIELYKKARYAYSFAGHEIEIEMQPDEFEHLIKDNDSYPVAVVGQSNTLDVYYGAIRSFEWNTPSFNY
ncbi:Imm64 family immunity protein [Niallia sp. 03190]|uniref:Imm64 family immunity protein n=1 Tax=Niallia sp. 03190 TaxID=3458061 RepID=UPI004043A357